MRHSTPRSRAAAFFGLLMAAALIASLLPLRWTSWTGNLLQPVNWLGGWITRPVVDAASRVQDVRVASEASGGDYVRILQENDRLRRLVTQQQASLQQLSEVVDELTAIRGQLRDSSSQIVLAAVLKWDTTATRETVDISAGSNLGVSVGDWVLAGGRAETDAEPLSGREMVQSQWVIGRIAATFRYHSRVQLCSDPDFGPLPVQVGSRPADGAMRVAERECLLYGVGRGRCEIRDAATNYFAEGYTHAYVTASGNLPMLLEVGAIRDARSLPESALHFDLAVEPARPVARVSRVYVLSIGRSRG